ncbi:MAG: hypothetical protein HYZ28_09195 [Myxococcales bacterium]|nr:hypothetical protein [Myxococcales bacterium]
MRRQFRPIHLLLLALAGCPQRLPPPPDAGQTDAGPIDAGIAEPPRVPLEIRVHASLPDGGAAPLDFGQHKRPLVEPVRSLQLTANLPLRNYRVRLFDEAERAVVSDDRAEDLPDSLRYEISLPEPLRSGQRYAIVLDAQTGGAFTDARGDAHADVRLEIQVSGEREKASKKKPAKKPKKKRR